MPGTAHELDVKVKEVVPGIARLLLPKAAVIPAGKPFTDKSALAPDEPQAPGLPMVMIVAAVVVFGAMLISFKVAVAGAIARL